MATQRDIQAEVTRKKIMQTAADEIYRVGFQSASIGEILRKLGVSKGCFYHHFPTKQELGYAVLEETFTQFQTDIWNPVLSDKNPLAAVINMLSNAAKNLDKERVKLGCPINNLAQEMSPIDEGFRIRVEHIYEMWRTRLTESLLRAQQDGYMHRHVEANEVAVLIMTVMQGAIGIAKNAQNPAMFGECTRGLIRYLQGLQKTN